MTASGAIFVGPSWMMIPRSLRYITLLAVVACCGGSQPLVAAGETKTLAFDGSSVAPRQEPLIVGIGVHFGIGGEHGYAADKAALLISAGRFASYRDDLGWSVFYAPPSGPGRQPAKLFNFIEMTKARPTLILGHPNPSVPDGNPPLTDTGRAAFANFTAKAVAGTRDLNPIYEIWNEWNMNAVRGRPWLDGPGDPSDPRAAANYAPLARASVKAIRKIAPDATVLVGAVGVDNDWKWTQSIVDMGVLDGASGLSVHMYNHCDRVVTNRTAREAVDRLSELQDILKSKRGGQQFPLYVTEVGWPTAQKPCAITRKVAADNLAQFILWSAATPWVKGVWAYELKDQVDNPNDLEANFGLYDHNYQPKPAACAVIEASKLAKEAAAGAKLQRPFEDVFILQIKRQNGIRLVAWTSRDAVQAAVTVVGAKAAVKSALLCGDGTAAQDSSLRIGATPVIIDIEGVPSADVRVAVAP